MPSKDKNYAYKIANELFNVVKENCESDYGCKLVSTQSQPNYYSMATTPFNAFDDLKNNISIIKLIDYYWLNFCIKFDTYKISEKHIEYELNSIFIKVFKEDKNNSSMALKFRAEWSVSDHTNNHAQPHWHIYPVIKNHICKGADDFKSFFELNAELIEMLEESEAKELSFSNRVDELERFHFAMASNWHNNINEHSIKFTNDMRKKWVEGCIKYIKHQLRA